MTDPKLINSPVSRSVEENGDRVEIAIYRLEDAVTEWSLEIVAAMVVRPSGKNRSILMRRRSPKD